MLFEYAPTFGKLITTGVVLNPCFQLFDLSNTVNWNTYPKFEDTEKFYRGSYGVCDDLDNLFAVYPELEAEGRIFVVSLTCIDRDDVPEFDGWRWHKWGDYIGKETPKCEYIYDEPIIDRVYCYQIYEKVV